MSNKKIKLKVTPETEEEKVNDFCVNQYLCRDILVNMFDWDIDIPRIFIEQILIEKGICAFWLIDNKIVVTSVKFIGDINAYGVGKDAFCITKNGISKTFSDWKNNNEVVICFNNYCLNDDYEAKITQNFLNESNISIECDIKGTRYNKIFKARDEVEKANLEKAIEANANGLPQVIIGASFGALIDSEIGENTETLEVSDIKSSDRLQYVSKLKDDIWKWFLNLYGLSALSNVKMAQQTSDEINNQLFSSFVLPISKLECRVLACKEISKKFNIVCDVKFSECWTLSYKRILKAVSDTAMEKNKKEDNINTSDLKEDDNDV